MPIQYTFKPFDENHFQLNQSLGPLHFAFNIVNLSTIEYNIKVFKL